MEYFTGRKSVDELDATDLDQTIASKRIESGRFGIQDDFAHRDFIRRCESPAVHCSDSSQNVSDLRPGVIESLRTVHDEISAAAFFGIRHLFGEQSDKFLFGHAGALQSAPPLDFGGH